MREPGVGGDEEQRERYDADTRCERDGARPAVPDFLISVFHVLMRMHQSIQRMVENFEFRNHDAKPAEHHSSRTEKSAGCDEPRAVMKVDGEHESDDKQYEIDRALEIIARRAFR